ncbi:MULTISPECIES: TetR/AcrR family transcriptional regulator [Alcaligenes]|uniref:TetR/AcrR family transcriptional regulator n=1 Tax=Alcaligenes parafaecalis TaxID=171260 RepID=A0ABT3VWE7_9BURK|nr:MULTISPECIES: TetR/AcrR family transcriptional regulator [Alcaligenes]MCX5466073.1 TetR/AcrR family transcriptional regulator [Alcaligenes parafaecalis]QTB99627.1 TetR/AcrR family transcriptional regulator [Alcaligenes sp. SORT26]
MPASTLGQRGPTEHHRREQIIEQAHTHFRLYGYRKTSVASLAKAIGVSSAYLYRFFDSKQAIGQAICHSVLHSMHVQLQQIVDGDLPPIERLRHFTETACNLSLELFLQEGRMQEVVIEALQNNWATVDQHREDLLTQITALVRAGRESGDFERRTPLDEVVQGILFALTACLHPVLLEIHPPEKTRQGLLVVTQLILRSLMP